MVMLNRQVTAFRLFATFAFLAFSASNVLHAAWTVTQPQPSSIFGVNGSVLGWGDASGPGPAGFYFGHYGASGFVAENGVLATVEQAGAGSTWHWSCTLPAPPGGWIPSPEDPNMPGMYLFDKEARIVYGTTGEYRFSKWHSVQ